MKLCPSLQSLLNRIDTPSSTQQIHRRSSSLSLRPNEVTKTTKCLAESDDQSVLAWKECFSREGRFFSSFVAMIVIHQSLSTLYLCRKVDTHTTVGQRHVVNRSFVSVIVWAIPFILLQTNWHCLFSLSSGHPPAI